jgi:predicted transposase/invertase (TIGR01784 family)
MKFDLSLKSALVGLEKSFIKAFLNIEVNDVEELNVEFPKIEEKEADYLFKAKLQNTKEIIVHIEFQATNHKDMHFRMLRYLTEIYKKYKLPILQLVLYIGDDKMSMKNEISFDLLDTKIDYSYKIINIQELDCDRFINSHDSDMVIMAILCNLKDKDKNKVINTIIQRLNDINRDDNNSFKNSLLKLEILSELRNLEDIVKQEELKVLEKNISVERLPSYMIGYEDGELKGELRGELRGEQKAKIESALIFIKDMNLNPKDVANKLNIPLDEIMNRLT